MAASMRYKATTFYDAQLKHIDNGGHTEDFQIDFDIKKGTRIRFKNLHGSYSVIGVTIEVGSHVIKLLCSPDVR